MRQVEIALELEGCTLARPVKNDQGVTMLEEGTRLTAAYLRRLRQIGVQSVCINADKDVSEADQQSEPRTTSPSSAGTESRSGRTVPVARGKPVAAAGRFRQVRDALVIRAEDRSPVGHWSELDRSRMNGLFAGIAARPEVTQLLEQLLAFDTDIFQHSVHVAQLTGYMGMRLDYEDELLTDVLIGALLFDIGMTRLPPSLIKSKRALSKEERVLLESHTFEGYQILSRVGGISPLSAACALQHHERYDGSGYPLRLKESDIPDYVQLIGIADVYDALISPRHHRKPYSEVEATEYLFASGNHFFVAGLVRLYIQHLSAYPVSTIVRLSTGQEAIVANYRSKLIHRPVVRVIREADGSAVEHPYELDLMEVHDVVVVSAI